MRRRLLRMILTGCLAWRTPRIVSRGLSARTVPAPTRIASTWERISWTRRRAMGPVIQWRGGLLPILPSRERAILRITYGLLPFTHVIKNLFKNSALSFRAPILTLTPDFRRILIDLPETFGFGSRWEMTTLLMPLAMIWSTQVGVFPR